jgi:Ca2+-binding RTX toxin-like protein
MRRWKMK